MLYQRSSFIKWLQEVNDCTIQPLGGDRRQIGVLLVRNGPATCHISTDSKDRIDYEEVWRICNKLYLVNLPTDKDLIRIE